MSSKTCYRVSRVVESCRRAIARFYLMAAGPERPDGRRRKPSSIVPSISTDGVVFVCMGTSQKDFIIQYTY